MRTKKIIVAMSGGIDSAVSAALLKRAGFNVEGVFLKLYDSPQFKEGEECVKRIAKSLDIPISVVDLRRYFKEKVVDYFLREYKRGRTPNPCVVCNEKIKFGIFLRMALNLGTDLIATGHYARIKNGLLFTARDKSRDQTYFLYRLTKRKLKRVVFPIGNYRKSQVKKIAGEFKIDHLIKPESRDVCFLGKRENDFFKKHFGLKPGPIFDTKGRKIGQHQGLFLYTVGQRKGIRVPGPFPYYVLRLDIRSNSLIVTSSERDLYKKELIATRVSWVSGERPDVIKVKAKIRYLHNPASAVLEQISKNNYRVAFRVPQRAVTPGQSVVFYSRKGGEVLGGGIIK